MGVVFPLRVPCLSPTGPRCLLQVPSLPSANTGLLTTLFSCLMPLPNTLSFLVSHPSRPVLPGGPSLAHRESSWQPAFQGAQRCRGHLCCGLAQPDGRAGACPSKCPPASPHLSPVSGGVAARKSPEEGAQDGQGCCGPEGEARAMSQEAPGWGLSFLLTVIQARRVLLLLANSSLPAQASRRGREDRSEHLLIYGRHFPEFSHLIFTLT